MSDELVISFRVDEKSLTRALSGAKGEVVSSSKDMNIAVTKLANNIEGNLVKAFRKQKQTQRQAADTTKKSAKEIRAAMQQQSISVEGTLQSLDKLGGIANTVFGAMITASPAAASVMALFGVEVQLLAMEFGDVLAPFLQIVLDLFIKISDILTSLPTPVKGVIVVFVLLVVAIIAITGAVTALTAVSLPLVAVILLLTLAVVALAYAWKNNLGGIHEIAAEVFGKLKVLFAELVAIVQKSMGGMTEDLGEINTSMEEIWIKIEPIVKLIADLFYTYFVAYITMVVKLFVEQISFMLKVINSVFKIISFILQDDWAGAWNEVMNLVDIWIDHQVKRLEIFFEFIKTMFNAIKTFVTDILTEIFGDGVGEKVGAVLGVITSLLNSLINMINSNLIAVIDDTLGWISKKVDKIPGVGNPGWGIDYRIPTLHGGGVFNAPGGQSEGYALLSNKEGVFTQAQMRSLGLMISGGQTVGMNGGGSRTQNSGMTVVQIMNPVFRDEGDMSVLAQAIQRNDYQQLSRENTTTR